MKNQKEVQINPVFRCLSHHQVQLIHRATLDILERTGVEVYNQQAVEHLRQAGAWVAGTRVRIPSSLVEWAIEAAPENILIWSRDGQPALDLSGSNVYFGPGPSCPHILDIYSGERRFVEKEDLKAYARLCEVLPNIDFLMSMGILSKEADLSDLLEFEAMVLNSKKPIVAWAWNEQGAQDIFDISLVFRNGFEDLRRRPFYMFYCEPTAPLRHTEEALRKLLFIAERGLPLIYGAGPVGGASSPVTLEGMIVEGNAEALSGLVIAQLKRAGSPFIFGSGTGPLDMSAMTVAYGAPEFMLGQAAFSELARFYGIPCWGFGGCSDSKLPDEQMSIQSALWNLISSLSGANLVHDVGFIESGMTGSMEAIVINDEIIGMVKRLLGRRFPENRNCHLTDSGSYETWAANGKSTLGWRAREKAKELLRISAEQFIPEKVIIQEIIQKARQRIHQSKSKHSCKS